MSNNQPTNSHNILIAEYTLGLLDRHDMAKAHQLLSHDDNAITAALDWENSLLELTDLLPPVDPSPLLLQRIQATLGHDAIPAPSSLYRQPASLRPKEGESVEDGYLTSEPAAKNAGNVTPLKRPSSPQSHASPMRPAPVTPVGTLPKDPEPAGPDGGALPAGTNPAQTTLAPHSPHRTSAIASDTGIPSVSAGQPSTNLAKKLFGKNPGRRANSSSATPAGRNIDRPHTAEHTFSGAGQSAGASASAAGHPAPRAATQASNKPISGPFPNAKSTPVDTQASSAAAPSPRKTAPLPQAIAITAPGAAPRAQSRRLIDSVWVWRGTTLIFAVLALALTIIPSTPSEPPVTIVKVAPTHAAILQAPGQSSTPAWLVTFDAQRNVLMSPEVRSDITADSSVQLWTYNETLPQPRSLGLIDPNKPITIPASLMGELGKNQFFEMTLEPQGGSPTASPSGPVLFIGRVVTFGVTQHTDPAPVVGTPPAS